MKYIVMCGGYYTWIDKPKQMIKLNGEMLFERTLRLLRECGVDNIAISSNRAEFEAIYKDYNVEYIKMDNRCIVEGHGKQIGSWLTAFPDVNEPVCFLFGDVIFSKDAIQKIIDTQTDDIEFFASAPPFAKEYHKEWAEPFGFKVVNTEHFKQAIEETERYTGWYRQPIAWELWQVIKNTKRCVIDYTNYTVINDYSCDIDYLEEIPMFEKLLDELDSKK